MMKRTLFPAVLVAIILLAGCSSRYRSQIDDITPPPSWPFFRGDLSATGAAANATFPGKLDVVWEFKSGDKAAGPLTIYYDHLVYPGAKNRIKFYQLDDGFLTGRIKPKGQTQSGFVARKNLAFFATGPKANLLRCVDIGQNKKTWTRRVVDVLAGILVIDRVVIVGATSGYLLALDPYNGDEIWNFVAESRFSAPPTFANGVLYQPGDDGILYALNVEDGVEKYRVRLDGPLINSAAVADKVYICDMYGNVYALDPQDGSELWRQELSGPIWTSPALSEEMVFVGHSGGEIVALDATSGDVVWSYETVDVVRASPLVVGNYLIVATLTGKVYSLDTFDGSVVDEKDLKQAISVAPVTDGGRVYVATDKGMITCFGAPALSSTDDN
ncbi:MAG: PQQ-binding-like beta-propeller repeat protein [Candidatus Zixiibacteriota bacterium]|nr:MAG: PQQ-binding-like beta-propeller repeat protein [candidate division Zixibacteria bacterium]